MLRAQNGYTVHLRTSNICPRAFLIHASTISGKSDISHSSLRLFIWKGKLTVFVKLQDDTRESANGGLFVYTFLTPTLKNAAMIHSFIHVVRRHSRWLAGVTSWALHIIFWELAVQVMMGLPAHLADLENTVIGLCFERFRMKDTYHT